MEPRVEMKGRIRRLVLGVLLLPLLTALLGAFIGILFQPF